VRATLKTGMAMERHHSLVAYMATFDAHEYTLYFCVGVGVG
jgi:hypothetical protein